MMASPLEVDLVGELTTLSPVPMHTSHIHDSHTMYVFHIFYSQHDSHAKRSHSTTNLHKYSLIDDAHIKTTIYTN